MNQGKLEVVKQEMARVNIDILGISKLKWTGMGEFNSDDHYIYYCGQESLRRNELALIVNKRVPNAVVECSLKNDRMISVCFQGKPFNITVIEVSTLVNNASLTMLKTFDCVDHHKLWKILKVMGIPDHLTCLLQNLYVGQEATVKTRHGTMDWLKIEKGVHQGCILSLCLFKFYAEYIMQNARWMKHKLESTLQGEISITLDTKLAPPLWHRTKRN